MNETMFVELCEQLADNWWLQGVLIAFVVCFFEDVARCAIGLLVAAGRINWWLAFTGMMIGSLMGDLGLYLIGRYAMDFCISRRWINAERIEKMKGSFSRHAVKAIIGARFLPGARSVAYAAAGATRYRILNFISVLSCVTLLQTLIYLYGTELVGERLLEDPRTRWIVAGVVLAAIITGHFIVKKRSKKRVEKVVDRPL